MIERFEPVTNVFDFIQHYWFHRRFQRAVALLVFLGYVASLVAIEANREGLLPRRSTRCCRPIIFRPFRAR